jgi:hypothetical protein
MKNIKNKLKEIFEKNQSSENLKACSFSFDSFIEDINTFIKTNDDIEKKVINNHYGEILVSFLFIYYNAFFSMAINQKEDNVFPLDRLNNGVNPNLILENMFTHVVNLSLSIIHLCKQGQDFASRVLLRSLFELYCISVIIIYSEEQMELYCKTGDDTKESKEIWYKYFRPKKLLELLHNIEKDLIEQPDIEYLDLMKNKWKDFYEFYSGISHNSYVDCMVSATCNPGNSDDILQSSLLGNYNIGIGSTIGKLNDLSFYFNLIHFNILFIKFGYRIHKDNQLWCNAILLNRCAHEFFEYIRKIDDD